MYMLIRLLLIASVLLVGCCVAAGAERRPQVALFVGFGLLLTVAARKQYQRFYDAHGTARWAGEDDLVGMIGASSGLILGRVQPGRPARWRSTRTLFSPFIRSKVAVLLFLTAFGFRRREPQQVRLPQAIHTAVFAPTGAGKGVSLVIPFLLTCPDSCVVIDFKGELARTTGRKRQGKTVLLDPYRIVTQNPDSLNPLDWIDRDNPESIDLCRDMAEAIVVRTGAEKEPHWNDAAVIWISAMIVACVLFGEPGERSMQTVRKLLTDPAQMDAAVKLLSTSDAWDGIVARLGHQLGHFKEKELASVLTTVNRHMRFFDTPAIAENTRSSTFDPADVRQGKMTVFLVLPPDHMRAQSGLLRLWADSMLRAVVRGGLQETNKVHFVLDEAASLGHMDAIDDAVDKYRGYGIRLMLMYQSLGQLKRCFPDGQDQTLLSNTTQVFFGVNDPQTADYVSTRLGEETILVTSGGTSYGGSRQTQDDAPGGSTSRSWNSNDNWNQAARRLLKPEEVMSLHERTAITFTPGVPPICTTLLRFYEEPRLALPPTWCARVWLAVKSFMWGVFLLACSGVLAYAVFEHRGTSPRSWSH